MRMRFRYHHKQETMEKGSSSSSSSSSDGLKFGKKIYFEGGLHPPSPAKKGRTGAAAHGGHPPRCQVEGCRVDLSDAKAYYCRHKVCGLHSKSPMVTVAGIEQRFCQQCSRFHQLPEFDQGKRSCRRRLAGHNERRRKPPRGPSMPSRYGSLSPSSFDSLVMDFRGRRLANPLPCNLLQQGWASDSNTGALSLLSNESWSSRNQRAFGLGVNNFLGPDDPVGQFPFASSGYRGDEMAPDMGLAVISNQTSNGTFSRDLGLAQPDEIEPSRGYDMHWSL